MRGQEIPPAGVARAGQLVCLDLVGQPAVQLTVLTAEPGSVDHQALQLLGVLAKPTGDHRYRVSPTRPRPVHRAKGKLTMTNWDHFYPLKDDAAGLHFESWTILAALEQTRRVEIGDRVNCISYRNANLKRTWRERLSTSAHAVPAATSPRLRQAHGLRPEDR